MTEKKEERYVSNNAQFIAEWNWDKNNKIGLDPSKITVGSHSKAWWICKYGHEWEAEIKNRAKSGTGCPYCSNKKVLIGFNDLATTNPEIAAEWHFEKNKELLPTMVSEGSIKKVWWKCSKGHEWRALVVNRAVRKSGCPYCANQKVLIGFNDLATTNPEIAAEWHFEKNKELLPTMVSPGSNKKVWWKCSKGHEWQTLVVKKAVRKNGCPYCSGHKVLAGFNDLATNYPDVAKEWHPTKNGELTPYKVSISSKKKAWWICTKGHEWQSVIGSRTALKAGCPICNQEMKTSFPEQAILFYCKKVTHAESRNIDFGKEIDIYLPEYKIGIEHNGKFYHRDKKESDGHKIAFFAERNIRIITVAESYANIVCDDIIEYQFSNNKESLNWAIRELFKKIGLKEIHINVEGDMAEIYSQYIISEKENSLEVKLPIVAKEWNYEKNGLLTPSMISNASGKKVWWKCSEGHEWKAAVNDRKKGYGCPYCSNNKVLEGFNDLATLYPIIASEWNYEKNENYLPTMVLPGSGKKVWWKCKNGHEWQAKVVTRKTGNGCPQCSKERVKKQK
ncbi:MAG: zinc-ribbon domain-containing protein [Clostridia bacterium]|nr:zinc-ribbon domain-containing protein [Clostridia bacterium]